MKNPLRNVPSVSARFSRVPPTMSTPRGDLTASNRVGSSSPGADGRFNQSGWTRARRSSSAESSGSRCNEALASRTRPPGESSSANDSPLSISGLEVERSEPPSRDERADVLRP